MVLIKWLACYQQHCATTGRGNYAVIGKMKRKQKSWGSKLNYLSKSSTEFMDGNGAGEPNTMLTKSKPSLHKSLIFHLI